MTGHEHLDKPGPEQRAADVRRRTSESRRPELTVGRADAAAEVEADLIAGRAVASLHGGHAAAHVPATPSADATIARAATPDGHGPIGPAGGVLSAEMQSAIVTAHGGGEPLPAPLRRQMEGTLDADFSGVRVHTGPRARALSSAMSARAFAVGSDLFFADGMPDTSTPAGTHLLAHELAHVKQSSQGIRRNYDTHMSDDDDPDMDELTEMFSRLSLNERDAGPRADAMDEGEPDLEELVEMLDRLSLDDDRMDTDEDDLGRMETDDASYQMQDDDLGRMETDEDDLGRMETDDASYQVQDDDLVRMDTDDTSHRMDDGVPDLDDVDDVDAANVDDLMSMFAALRISVPFQTDIDAGEAHQVRAEDAEIIVASNPKPLKHIITTGHWMGYAIPPKVVTNLDKLRKEAKLALYTIAGNQKRKLPGARTKGNMSALRAKLHDIATVLSKLASSGAKPSSIPATDLSTSDHFGDKSSKVEGRHVRAVPLSINSASPGSQPKDGRLMKSVRKLAGAQSKSYVQMHLLNDLVFGPGQLWNLTPGPKQSNVTMEKRIEDPLKRAILGKGLVIDFEAEVTYAHDPFKATDAEIDQDPAKYVFQSIKFRATQLSLDTKTNTWVKAAKQDADVAAVNGGIVKWDYGNLARLKPKPRIFAPTTTVADLTNVGIKPGAAKRVVDFVQNNPTWRPKGQNKRQKLAEAVKAYDGGKQIPNVQWPATSVLWT